MTSPEYIEEDFPKWLKELAIFDSFDWDKSIKSDMSRFTDFMTLHDSYWVGIFSHLDNSVNLIINFDSIWNKEISKHDKNEGQWPYLIIKFRTVLNITFDSSVECGMTIGHHESHLIDELQKESLLSTFDGKGILNEKLVLNMLDAEIFKTVIEDVCGGFIEILHKGEIQILLYNIRGELITLPEGLKVE